MITLRVERRAPTWQTRSDHHTYCTCTGVERIGFFGVAYAVRPKKKRKRPASEIMAIELWFLAVLSLVPASVVVVRGQEGSYSACYICGGPGTEVGPGATSRDPDGPDGPFGEGVEFCGQLEELALKGFLSPGECEVAQNLEDLDVICR